VLEITETAMMQDTDRAIVVLSELKALGLKLAVDDFGTGYSSLSYLQRFPVDLLKIDRSFVSDIDETEAEASFAHTILMLANTLHLTVVAEGVETGVQAAVLERMGCHLAQGYHYCHPIPGPQLNALLHSKRRAPSPPPTTLTPL
jgi:EAL domain-containing protein (putative c-di-GMP-specific phosphodiesterase class I)